MTLFWTVLLLTLSNIFMTFAWYGPLKWNHLVAFGLMIAAVGFVFWDHWQKPGIGL